MKLKNLIRYIFFILFLLFSCQNSNNIPSFFISGNVVNADNYPSIQDAVDALADEGGTITWNAIDMSNRNSIETEGSNFITRYGNIFSGGPDDRIYGIVMKDVNDVSISGNTMVKPLEGGIYILGSENKYINITGNTIKTHPKSLRISFQESSFKILHIV